jgi:two-component system response regulator AtoC
VADGQFREDLYFRLNVVAITLPPLRERREEIPLLTEYFLKKYSVQYNKPPLEIGSETTQLFMEHDWPGNIRELENLIKRAVVLGAEAPIRKELNQSMAMAMQRAALPQHARPAASPAAATRAPTAPAPQSPAAMAAAAAEAGNYSLKDISRNAAREAERELILKMLQQTRWNRKETAEILGISYKALLYKIKENGLDKAS